MRTTVLCGAIVAAIGVMMATAGEPFSTVESTPIRSDVDLQGVAVPAGSHEPAWSKAIAEHVGGIAEHRTPDGSRVDVLTDDVAWEVEWAAKWKEAPGQALLYSIATGRRPGVILLFKGGDERLQYLRCMAVCDRAGIRLRTIDTRVQK